MINLALIIVSSIATGALVGYVTNLIAVRMLFHPYKPIRIPLLGLRVQGLLPAKKDEFADKIGEIAEEYLKTPEFKRELEVGLSSAIKESIEGEIMKSLLNYSPFVAGLLSPYISQLAKIVSERLIDILSRGVTSATMEKMDIKRIVSERIKSLDAKEIEEFYKRFARRELRMIEYAGLFLGALIGPLEALLLMIIH